MSPRPRDVVKRRSKDMFGGWEKHPRHIREKTFGEIFLIFREKHPEFPVKETLFRGLKPWFVKPRRQVDLEVCCCKHHTSVEQKLTGLDNARKQLRIDLRQQHEASGLPFDEASIQVCLTVNSYTVTVSVNSVSKLITDTLNINATQPPLTLSSHIDTYTIYV